MLHHAHPWGQGHKILKIYAGFWLKFLELDTFKWN